MPEASPLPTSTRRLFSPASTLVLIVIAGTLLSLFAIQLDISESFHSTWSAITSNRTSHESQAVIDTDLGTQYRLANALTGVPTVEEIKTAPHNYKWYTEAKLRWLTACLTRGDCPKNAEKVSVRSGCGAGAVVVCRSASYKLAAAERLLAHSLAGGSCRG